MNRLIFQGSSGSVKNVVKLNCLNYPAKIRRTIYFLNGLPICNYRFSIMSKFFVLIRPYFRSFSSSTITRSSEGKDKKVTFKTDPVGWLKGLPALVWHGIMYTWLGFKLLGLNIKTASILLIRLMKGSKLTRREQRLLVTTAADIFRMVPFSFFIIVPMAEFLLPIALKLFPNMLPSTFTTDAQNEAKEQRLLKARIGMAKFVRDTALHINESIYDSKNVDKFKMQFEEFMKGVNTGQEIGGSEVYQFISKFKDDITLENLKRSQLQQLCKFLDIVPYGPSQLLRYQLQNRVSRLHADDRLIRAEGLSSLSLIELKQACAARGMSPMGTRAKLEELMEEWLDLSLNQKVPTALLILSRAFRLMNAEDPQKGLLNTIKQLDQKIIDGVETQVEYNLATDMKQKYEIRKEETAKVFEQESVLKDTGNALSVEGIHDTKIKVSEIGNLITESIEPGQEEKESLEIMEQQFQLEKSKMPGAPVVNKIEKKFEKMVQSIGKDIQKASVGSKRLLDLDHDGKFSTEELCQFLVSAGLSLEESTQFVEKLDRDKDGFVDIEHIKKLRTLDINIDTMSAQAQLDDDEGFKKRAEIFKKLQSLQNESKT